MGFTLYGSEIWTKGLPDKINIEAFEMWRYQKMLKIRQVDEIPSQEMFERNGNDGDVLFEEETY